MSGNSGKSYMLSNFSCVLRESSPSSSALLKALLGALV